MTIQEILELYWIKVILLIMAFAFAYALINASITFFKRHKKYKDYKKYRKYFDFVFNHDYSNRLDPDFHVLIMIPVITFVVILFFYILTNII